MGEFGVCIALAQFDGLDICAGKAKELAKDAPEPERAPAQVIPFPAPAPARKGAALLPGLQRTRGGFIARLGEIFAGKKESSTRSRRCC